jgi:glycerol-3-phosphate dehydrogenase
MYDILAGKQNMESSYVLGKGKALDAFPMLKQDGLRGAVVYYDGAFSCLLSLRIYAVTDNLPFAFRDEQANTTTPE